jgi:hypothetical protein
MRDQAEYFRVRADEVRRRSESAHIPNERHNLLNMERVLRQMAEIQEWLDDRPAAAASRRSAPPTAPARGRPGK